MRITSDETRAVFAPLAQEVDEWSRIQVTLSEDGKKFILDAWRTSPTGFPDTAFRGTPCLSTRELLNRLSEVTTKPTASKESLYCRICGATDINVELLWNMYPRDQIKFFTPLAHATFFSILARSLAADVCADNVAEFKANKTLPEIAYEKLECNPDQMLAAYQWLAACNTYLSPGYGLFMKQGTGKTPTSIAAICSYVKDFQQRVAAGEEPDRMCMILIVAPNSVRMNWEKELAKFSTVHYKCIVLRGTPLSRIKKLTSACNRQNGEQMSVVICGYETLSKSWEYVLDQVAWDVAGLDEAHYIKDPKRQRCKTAHKLRDIANKRIALTGTPICNSVMDLWSLLEFLGKGYSGFTTFEAFRKFYGQFREDSGGRAILMGTANLPFIQERLARYSYFITKEEAMPDLPQVLYSVHEIEMSAEQVECYTRLSRDLMVIFEAEINSGKSKAMVTNCILTQMLRLTQITSGFVTISAEHDINGELIQPKEVNYLAENPKIRAVEEYVERLLTDPDEQHSKMIVWACFIPDLDYIESVFVNFGVNYVRYSGSTSFDDRLEAERRFNEDDDCRFFLGNPTAGGIGLNLLGYPPGFPERSEMNSDLMLVFSQGWSQPVRSQKIDRSNRRGSRVPLRVVDLCVPDSIDEVIRARVMEKQINAFEISDLRNVLQVVTKLGEQGE